MSDAADPQQAARPSSPSAIAVTASGKKAKVSKRAAAVSDAAKPARPTLDAAEEKKQPASYTSFKLETLESGGGYGSRNKHTGMSKGMSLAGLKEELNSNNIVKGSAMYCFGRLWNVAAEDTAIPAICELGPNFVFVLFLLYAFKYVPDKGIADPMAFAKFVQATALIHLIVWILNLLTLWKACCNPLFKQSRAIKILMACRALMVVGEFAVAIYGSTALWGHILNNDLTITWIFRIIVFFNWVQALSALGVPFLVYSVFGSGEHENDVSVDAWAGVVRILFCKCKSRTGGLSMQEEDFLRIAKLLRRFFDDVRGWTLTDIAAGIALVNAHQKFRPRVLEKVVLGEELKQEHIEADDRFVADLYRYSCYFVGAYGAGMHCLMKPWECCCLLSGCQHEFPNTDGTDCCGASRNAFLRRTEYSHGDLLYSNLENDFASVAFFVVADHELKEVVICIRGTFSLADVATDLDADVLDLTDYGFEGHYAHRGIARAALRMKEKIENCKQFRDFINTNPDYKVRIVGHSLGGGTAAILTMLIKDYYSDVKCIAYASPPVFDYELATSEEVNKHIINIIHNNDCVPRLSYSSVLALKAQVVYLLNAYVKYHEMHTDLPSPKKWQMLLSLSVKGIDPDSESSRDYKKFFLDKKLEKGLEELLETIEKNEKRCYLPGRQFHVEPITLFERCFDCVERRPPTIREAKCEEFLEFLVRNDMVMNHMPWEYLGVLNALSVRVDN
eukprot:TRINITY_DN3457_c0_g1_i1.p1 TRINITY_DN3457_c0_g1~~TRINITY_DN3457_c0_g1_i1.p1  ORF type:complete len:749 (+),score=223.58 TRINITY_DN3457_c0_g1_i1:52-2247(+)